MRGTFFSCALNAVCVADRKAVVVHAIQDAEALIYNAGTDAYIHKVHHTILL